MKLPKNEGGDFELAPEGNHLAVCFKVIDLGTQEVEWSGNIKQQRKVLIGWELPNETMKDGQPFVISRRYTFSTFDRAIFRQHLEAWRGKKFVDSDFGDNGFDVRNLLEKGCLVNVIHNESKGRTYANVAGVAKLPKGTEAPRLHNPPVYFSLDDPDMAIFDTFPEWLQEVISQSPEFQQFNGDDDSAEVNQEFDEAGADIPF